MYYDPMIAKVITWAPTRQECIQKMRKAISGTVIVGLTTNQGFLLKVSYETTSSNVLGFE